MKSRATTFMYMAIKIVNINPFFRQLSSSLGNISRMLRELRLSPLLTLVNKKRAPLDLQKTLLHAADGCYMQAACTAQRRKKNGEKEFHHLAKSVTERGEKSYFFVVIQEKTNRIVSCQISRVRLCTS